MLERHIFHVFGFQILANSPAPQQIPAMIRRYLIQPRGERPRRIVLPDFLPHFHEYFGGGVLSVFARRQSPPAKSEYRRRVLPVNFPPSVWIAFANPRQGGREVLCAHAVR